MQLRIESQENPVAAQFEALIAVVCPILEGLLFGIKQEVVAEVGGPAKVKLFMMARLYLRGDGDLGICFEFAVHDAIRRRDSHVLEKVVESLGRHCNVPGNDPASILFGAEKSGRVNIIETARGILTDDSLVLTGKQARPVKLKRHLDALVRALRTPAHREMLPSSISGLWKADLFLGHKDSDRWVGTTVKIKEQDLEAAPGLRIGIVPADAAGKDLIRLDSDRNIVVCPLRYDGVFMRLFIDAWNIVQQFIRADANMPPHVGIPEPVHREVAKFLFDRREFNVIEVIDALRPLAQPSLLVPHQQKGDVLVEKAGESTLNTVIAPISQGLRG